MPAETFVEAHWYTGKLKTRCMGCGRVVFATQAEAEQVAAMIAERHPGMRATLATRCGHWHVTGPRRKSRPS